MPRRSKKQIQEDNQRIFEKKYEVLHNLNENLESISQMSDSDLYTVNSFITQFIKCELVYKTLYIEMKKMQGIQVDINNLKFNVQHFEAALRFFGIDYEHDKMNMMFATKKSYLVYRNNIIHGFKSKSIQAVIDNYSEIEKNMNNLLENVKNALDNIEG